MLVHALNLTIVEISSSRMSSRPSHWGGSLSGEGPVRTVKADGGRLEKEGSGKHEGHCLALKHLSSRLSHLVLRGQPRVQGIGLLLLLRFALGKVGDPGAEADVVRVI